MLVWQQASRRDSSERRGEARRAAGSMPSADARRTVPIVAAVMYELRKLFFHCCRRPFSHHTFLSPSSSNPIPHHCIVRRSSMYILCHFCVLVPLDLVHRSGLEYFYSSKKRFSCQVFFFPVYHYTARMLSGIPGNFPKLHTIKEDRLQGSYVSFRPVGLPRELHWQRQRQYPRLS